MTKSTFKKALCALALVGACTSANAATTDLGPLSIGAPTPFSGTVLARGPFLDVFTFSLPVNGGSGYSVVNFPLDIPGVGTFNTVLSTMVLVSNPDGILFNTDDTALSTVSGPAGSLSLTWGPTSGGPMYLSIDGITNGDLGGLYSGAIAVSPIPEPSPWAMLIVGVALVGFSSVRRMR
jgi:hypothetical protein